MDYENFQNCCAVVAGIIIGGYVQFLITVCKHM